MVANILTEPVNSYVKKKRYKVKVNISYHSSQSYLGSALVMSHTVSPRLNSVLKPGLMISHAVSPYLNSVPELGLMISHVVSPYLNSVPELGLMISHVVPLTEIQFLC